MNRSQMVQAMSAHARSLFERNYTYSTGGNLSHRYGEGCLITATGTSFGRLAPESFVACDLSGRPLPGEAARPSKEVAFHAAIYRQRPTVQAVLHLHSPAAIALSCLAEPTDESNVLPAVTSGSITRVGRVPLVEYLVPGSPQLARRIEQLCQGVNAIVLQNHGALTFAPSLDQAVSIFEELEQNIRVWLLTHGTARLLSDEEVASSAPLLGAAVTPGTQSPRLRARGPSPQNEAQGDAQGGKGRP